MNIHVVIPVFNRIYETKKIVTYLRKQTIKNLLKLIIVDDGSTDGTSDWLNKQPDIQIINGNGLLLWGGAINLALKDIFNNCKMNDWVLLINNDVEIEENYIETLLKIAIKYNPCAVGSIVKKKNGEIVSLGPKISTKKLLIKDLYSENFISKNENIIENVDALSGRGVLYPIKSLIEVKGMRPNIFPHYFADYELSLRVKNKGYKLILSMEGSVYTDEDFDLIKHQRKKQSLIFYLFSKKSSSLIYSKFLFWWKASNNKERISLPLRIFLIIMLRVLRKLL